VSVPTTCLHLRVDTASTELACSRAWDLGATAISEQDTLAGTLLIIGFANDEATSRASEELGATWTAEIMPADVEAQDGWKDFVEPIHVGQRLVLEPAWLAASSWPSSTVLRLDSERVFGSGTHPTTRLCLEALEQTIRGGERVLDIGAGSGVLGLCAAKLGARSVAMVDIDPSAGEVIAKNAANNGVSDQVESFHESATETSGLFDLIVANILIGALVELAPLMLDRLHAGGHLIVSGLWGSQWKRLLLHLDHAPLLARTHNEGWSCLLLQKADTAAEGDPEL